ncbi:MAG TPA: N-acetylmuramoyl-L-alanine amidase [Solirubrobacterales bacterium]|nr:N-acetylmuramoyl-L-alanine amidase [Solirubrobacterales bacterium]
MCSRKTMRGRLIAALSLALLGALAWVAAPALSLRPYMPGGVDFERGLPEAKRLPAGAVAAARDTEPKEAPPRWISPPVEAPHEFDLVGVARERRSVQIRVRDEGGGWSDWAEQEDGTPVYVDGADDAQVRAPFNPRGRLHFVNVSGTAGGLGSRLLSSAREVINSAFISIASTSVAEALAPKPPVVSRAGWGADLPDGGCPPRGPAEYGAVSAAVIHHTVNANDYAPEEAAAIVLGICRFHVFGNGWNDIGYNALVDRYGTLYEGRAGGLKQPVVGAQAQGFNSQTTSIASIGDHTSELPTPESQRSIIRYLAWKMGVNRAYPVTTTVQLTSGGGSENRYPAGTAVTVPRIIGHTTLGATACPGGQMIPLIPQIQAAVQKRIKRYAKQSRARCKRNGRKGKRCKKRKPRAAQLR